MQNVDRNLPNTLIISVVNQHDKTAVLGNLTTEKGAMVTDVIEVTGAPLWATVAQALGEIDIIRPGQVVVYSNDDLLVRAYTAPVRLQPRTEKDADKIIPAQWSIIRSLCKVNRWQFVKIEASKMKRTMQLWESHFANRKPSP